MVNSCPGNEGSCVPVSIPTIGLLDLGSSRVKWQRRTLQGEILARHRCDWSEVMTHPDLFDPAPKQVWMVAVNGVADQAQRLRTRLREWGTERIEVVVPLARGPGGLQTGYDLRQLGPDRYAALLGACAKGPLPAVVIDAGTAVTVDYLDVRGVHRGGYILPGFRLGRESVRSLFSPELQELVRQAASEPGNFRYREGIPGRNTASALVSGWTLGLAAALDRLIRMSSNTLSGTPVVWMTGGDAHWLARFMDSPCQVEADLLMEGLWFIAGQASSETPPEAPSEPRY